MQSENICAKKCAKNAELVFIKNSTSQVESVNVCSFAFNNQNNAQTKESLAGTCVPASPAFRNSAC